MKIVKHGILYSGKKYTFDCENCGCKFKMRANDAYAIGTIPGGDKLIGWKLRFKCPECNTDIYQMIYKEHNKEQPDDYYDGTL